MIGPRSAMGAVVARHHHVEQLDHDLAVNLGQMVERQIARIERAHQGLARILKLIFNSGGPYSPCK